MRAGSNKWWLLPFGILAASALVAFGIIVFEPSFVDRSSAEVVQRATSEMGGETATADCSDAPVSDYSCYQEHHQEVESETDEVADADCSDASSTDYPCIRRRYQGLVRDFGVEATFATLKSELNTNEFIRSNCHQVTHVIGRAAAEVYGDIPTTYSQGDIALASFCGSGYYHGAMEAIVSKIGAGKILDEANTICANLGGHQKYSFHHYNCAHGLGHGFMSIHDNELFESLKTCDTLTDEWERNRCYGGVFMENIIAKNNPGHPSKYLKADQPLYPCDAVESRYKDECYQRQSSYALETQGNDFARVFDLCAEVEADFRPACYQGLGWDASVQSLKQSTSDAGINEFTRMQCMLGKDYEAQFNCVVGAVDYFIRDSYSDTRARAFCESLGLNLRASCLEEASEYYASLRPPSER